MAGSIADFKASFNTDLARPNRFDVFIPVPLGLLRFVGTTRQIKMRCESTELPGRSISTASTKIYNIEEKYPYQTTYGDISLTFIVDDDMSEKKFFDAWLDWINPSNGSMDMKYKNQYAVPITIFQYDLENKISYSVQLLDAFPVSTNGMGLDWSSDGTHKLTVTFAYTRWRNNSIEARALEFFDNSLATVLGALT
jgi:hypothetical protein